MQLDIVNDGLLAAYDIAADGTATALDWDDLTAPRTGSGWRWVHLHRDGARAQDWLIDYPDPPTDAVWALLEDDTRPRVARIGDGDLVILRGVNLNAGAEPEDMISVRLYVTDTLIVSVVLRKLYAIETLLERAQTGELPLRTGSFLTALVEALRERVEPVLDELEDVIARSELDLMSEDGAPSKTTRQEFTDARQDALIIRRYLAPQADALRRLAARRPTWLEDAGPVAEEAESFARIVADLDAVRERAAVVRDEMSARTAERANDIVLLLSIVSAVFLPITFVTGLLGMNVGGIPLAETTGGFWIVCAALGATALSAVLIVRRLLRLI